MSTDFSSWRSSTANDTGCADEKGRAQPVKQGTPTLLQITWSYSEEGKVFLYKDISMSSGIVLGGIHRNFCEHRDLSRLTGGSTDIACFRFMDDDLGQIGRAERSTDDHHRQVPRYEEKLAGAGEGCDIRDTHGGGVGRNREADLWQVKLGFRSGATGESWLEEECRVLWAEFVIPSPTCLHVEVLIPV